MCCDVDRPEPKDHFSRSSNRLAKAAATPPTFLLTQATLLSDVAGTVKPERCTCSQEKVLQQHLSVSVTEYSSN